MLNSNALTKVQSIIWIAVIVVAGVGGGAAYLLSNGEEQSSETIKIGLLKGVDDAIGKSILQAVVLAAEQLNDEGGIMGKQVEVKLDVSLSRLFTIHEVDFVCATAGHAGFGAQDLFSEYKKIFFDLSGAQDEFTQRILDDFECSKYYFRMAFNANQVLQSIIDPLLFLREQTGFNRVGLIRTDVKLSKGIMDGLEVVLPELGFDVVYREVFPLGVYGTLDFTSYFAVAEAEGVEVLVPLISGSIGIPFVKEWYDRQSPMVIYGGYIGGGIEDTEGWEITGGSCKYISVSSIPSVAGYPLTSKTIPYREAYIDRWGEVPDTISSNGYNTVRYILPDAIDRAGTFETDAVIQALERTSIETTDARNFVFTSSHDIMMGDPNNLEADYPITIQFQWQNGELVPVFPKKIIEEAGTTLTFPDWPGPWDNIS